MVKLKKIIKTINMGLLVVFLLLIVNININSLIAIPNNKIMTQKNENMKISNIYLEKEEDISNYLIRFNCYECFSSLVLEYPCYNGENIRYDLSWIIQNPPLIKLNSTNYKLMCIVFDKGIREKKDFVFSLEDLKNMSNGASNMYIFWLKELGIKNEVKKDMQNIKQIIFNRLEIEFQKNIIVEMDNKINLLKEEQKNFQSKFLVKQLEILQLQVEKKFLENNLKSKTQELLNTQKATETEITHLRKEIQNIQIQLDIKNQENSNKNQKIEELKKQLNLLKTEIEKIKEEKIKYQVMKKSLEQKQNTYSGIFSLLYNKMFE
ncbi:hypothetical protein H7686_0001130 [Candidatus Phytoplasma asiaticum]|uniref:Sequence-variable mosaic (SVM) signal sequence domain-containing protein n=1 Tax=Candidatus Phytoplasma asiaticum TaxID=2763338 RepID=A0AAX3B9U6_9MOLU|nr:hypothetical protein ['Parthenium hysterophorus' phyllody phytoplasma]UQV27406.1 hypothetical protein H7686_0001130 ['Parthenium hysterophorus' phyllody phytoplasma]